jgi:hypothetical protein
MSAPEKNRRLILSPELDDGRKSHLYGARSVKLFTTPAGVFLDCSGRILIYSLLRLIPFDISFIKTEVVFIIRNGVTFTFPISASGRRGPSQLGPPRKIGARPRQSHPQQ